MTEFCSTSALRFLGNEEIDSFNIKKEFLNLKKGTCKGTFLCETCGNTIEICNDKGTGRIMGIDKKEDPIDMSLDEYEKKYCTANSPNSI